MRAVEWLLPTLAQVAKMDHARLHPYRWDQGPSGAPIQPVAPVMPSGPGGVGIGGQAFRGVVPPDPKKARTVYVGGVTPDMSELALRQFFEEKVRTLAFDCTTRSFYAYACRNSISPMDFVLDS